MKKKTPFEVGDVFTVRPSAGMKGRLDDNDQIVESETIPKEEMPEITFEVVPERPGELTDFWCKGGDGHEDEDWMTMQDDGQHGVLCKKCRGIRQIG
jgi:hypothetical protein